MTDGPYRSPAATPRDLLAECESLVAANHRVVEETDPRYAASDPLASWDDGLTTIQVVVRLVSVVRQQQREIAALRARIDPPADDPSIPLVKG